MSMVNVHYVMRVQDSIVMRQEDVAHVHWLIVINALQLRNVLPVQLIISCMLINVIRVL